MKKFLFIIIACVLAVVAIVFAIRFKFTAPNSYRSSFYEWEESLKNDRIDYEDDNTQISRVDLDLYSFIENPNNIYRINFPYCYYTVSEDNDKSIFMCSLKDSNGKYIMDGM